jgi:hypothetical protein
VIIIQPSCMFSSICIPSCTADTPENRRETSRLHAQQDARMSTPLRLAAAAPTRAALQAHWLVAWTEDRAANADTHTTTGNAREKRWPHQWSSTWGTRKHLTSIGTKHRHRSNLEPALIVALAKIRPRTEVLACQKSSH